MFVLAQNSMAALPEPEALRRRARGRPQRVSQRTAVAVIAGIEALDHVSRLLIAALRG